MSDYLAHNNRPANEAHQMDTTDHQVPTDDCYRLEPAADILDHHDLAGITDQDMPGIFDQYELEASFDQQDHQMDIFEQQGLAQILNQPGPAHIVHQQEPADIVNQQADRCTICFEEYATAMSVVELACGHNFHAECIGRWIVQSRTCPLCRHNVP